jgi:hypothetical protein
MEPNWLKWAKELTAISQNGLTYSGNAFDFERYEKIRRIAVEMMSTSSDLDTENLLTIFFLMRRVMLLLKWMFEVPSFVTKKSF